MGVVEVLAASAAQELEQEALKAKIEILEGRRALLRMALSRYGAGLGAAKRALTRMKSWFVRRSALTPVTLVESRLYPSQESQFTSRVAQVEQRQAKLRVDKQALCPRQRGMHSAYDRPKRLAFNLSLTEITYEVETVTDLETGQTWRACTDQEGPAGMSYTWDTVRTVVKLHAGFAIPNNRIARMAGHPCLSESKIYAIQDWTARLLAPIYLQLFNELSEADLWSGDDTNTKMLDLVAQPIKEGRPLPLHHLVDHELTFQSTLARGEGLKKKLNVTLVSGRTQDDPRSTIRFFRTHQGSFGNLVSRLLELRNPKNKKVIIHSDRSSSNLVEKHLEEAFEIDYAGCGAHARRDFWRYRDQDQDFCYYILLAFAQLAELEQAIAEAGRHRIDYEHFRRYGRMVWIAIKNRCQAAMTGIRTTPGTDSKHAMIQWPPSHPLYRAAQYVVKNFDQLTYYLQEPRIPWTTNAEERGLRFEKCLLQAAKFSRNRNGRVVLDILRTFVATAVAAQVELRDYFQWVYVNRQKLEDNAEKFTPYQYALHLASLPSKVKEPPKSAQASA